MKAALLVAFAAAFSAAAQAQQPIRIGASIAKTGSLASLGQNQLRGYELCIKHLNEKGGLLARPVQLIVEDDESQPATAARIYEKLIGQEKVDAVLGPYSSPVTEAVAHVVEKYRMPMVASGAAATSIFKKGRRYVFMIFSPAEVYLEGVIDIAAKRGLKTIAIINENTIFTKASAQGALELAKRKNLQVVLAESYPQRTTDFSAILARVRAANPDVVAAATYFEDAVAITRKMRQLDINPKMYGGTVGVDLPKFHAELGNAAEFVYGATQWEPELVTLRAGGLIPIARQYPGANEFVEAHNAHYPGAGLSYHTAGGYGGCQILTEAITRAASLQGDRIRDAILKMELNTVNGGFKVDADGFQVSHKMLTFQWQDGKKVIVWPEELAPVAPRFPTPPWNKRS